MLSCTACLRTCLSGGTAVLLAVALFEYPAAAQLERASGWSVQVGTGVAQNLGGPLAIQQAGFSNIQYAGFYSSRSLEPPYYYAVRIGRWLGRRGYEVEFLHHKVYLENRTAEINRFDIQNGYNFLTFNFAFREEAFIWRLGAGVVITYPENRVRGQTLSRNGGLFQSGYYLSGPAVQAAIEKRFFIGDNFFASLEAKAYFSYVWVPVAGGEANLLNVSGHLVFWLGSEF